MRIVTDVGRPSLASVAGSGAVSFRLKNPVAHGYPPRRQVKGLVPPANWHRSSMSINKRFPLFVFWDFITNACGKL